MLGVLNKTKGFSPIPHLLSPRIYSPDPLHLPASSNIHLWRGIQSRSVMSFAHSSEEEKMGTTLSDDEDADDDDQDDDEAKPNGPAPPLEDEARPTTPPPVSDKELRKQVRVVPVGRVSL